MPKRDIRKFIVDQVKRGRKPPTLNAVARQMNMSQTSVEEELRNSQPLSRGLGLTPEQASKIVRFYGKGAIFSAELEWLIAEGEKSGARVKQFARKARRTGSKRAK